MLSLQFQNLQLNSFKISRKNGFSILKKNMFPTHEKIDRKEKIHVLVGKKNSIKETTLEHTNPTKCLTNLPQFS